MKREPFVLIVNAVIWGAVMIASSLALKGTGAFQEIQHFLGGGAGFTMLLIVWGFRRKQQN